MLAELAARDPDAAPVLCALALAGRNDYVTGRVLSGSCASSSSLQPAALECLRGSRGQPRVPAASRDPSRPHTSTFIPNAVP